MKKHILLSLLILLVSGSALSAKDFDWSECWCNYGGGVKEGDFIVNVDGGLWYSDFSYSAYDDFWFIPPVMAEVQYVTKIWELPFTFGVYVGMRSYGYEYKNAENESVSATYFGVFFGGEAAYHIQLPPENLDLYATTRIGANIPFVKPGKHWTPDYFQFGQSFGANWFFNDTVGINLEFGFPFSKFGVALKF